MCALESRASRRGVQGPWGRQDGFAVSSQAGAADREVGNPRPGLVMDEREDPAVRRQSGECALGRSKSIIDMQVFACILFLHMSESMNADAVFRALSDPTRRKLLDLLYERNGQSLGQLCENLDMTRQSVTQHLGILEAANLVSTVRRGREKLHFINPVPLHEVYERWVRKFEHNRLRLLHDLKGDIEGTES